jgi:hypothetical protein
MGLFGRKKDAAAPSRPAIDATRALELDLLYAEPPRLDPAREPAGVTITAIAGPADGAAYAALSGVDGSAADVVARLDRCHHGLRLVESDWEALDHETRYGRFVAAVAAVTEETAPLVFDSRLNGGLLDPARALDDRFALAAAVRRSGTPAGDCTVDTVGLAWLGLPDLQIRFNGLDVDAVETYLRGLVEYLFEEGDALRDGKTIQGVDFHDRWKCSHVPATIAPARTVIDIDPGRHYAVADRRH